MTRIVHDIFNFRPMETSHKEIRRIIRENTRRDTLKNCLTDCLHFRMRWTNYLQRKLRSKKKRIVKDPMETEDDRLVASFFLNEDEEVTEEKDERQYSYS